MTIITLLSSSSRNGIRRRVATVGAALAVAAGSLALTTAPASAVTPSQWASGWVTRTPAGAVSSWVSTGAKATLTDLGAGKWKVTFPGITAGWGIPTATNGTDFTGGSCVIDSYGAS